MKLFIYKRKNCNCYNCSHYTSNVRKIFVYNELLFPYKFIDFYFNFVSRKKCYLKSKVITNGSKRKKKLTTRNFHGESHNFEDHRDEVTNVPGVSSRRRNSDVYEFRRAFYVRWHFYYKTTVLQYKCRSVKSWRNK